MHQFPEDWWKREAVCAAAMREWLRPFTMGFVCHYELGGKRDVYRFSGFLMLRGEHAVFATAGHAIKYLREISKDPSAKIVSSAIVDNCTIASAKAVPIEFAATPSSYCNDVGLDFGALLLHPNVVRNLVDGGGVRFITERECRAHDSEPTPEGFILCGYPKQASELFCLPVSQTDRRESVTADDFWSDEGAFYGQIEAFTVGTTPPTFDVAGMSGGPLFSFVRLPAGLSLHLVGVMRGWSPRLRVARCEPIERVLRALDGLAAPADCP